MAGKFIKNYYDILHVASDADDKELKSAYRDLAKKYHPDKGTGSSPETFREIQEAYEVLSDPQRRGEYDKRLVGHNAYEPLPDRDFRVPQRPSSEDLFSLFDRFFADLERNFFDGNAWPIFDNRVYNVTVDLTPHEADQGLSFALEVLLPVECPRCWGHGRSFSGFRCPLCQGQGAIHNRRQVSVNIPAGVKSGDRLEIPVYFPEIGRGVILLGLRVASK